MARKSILVVDDEKNQREILETILSGEGYDVTTASSGEAAMKFVQSRRFDLVLTDLKMTGMSGTIWVARWSMTAAWAPKEEVMTSPSANCLAAQPIG